MTAGEVRQQERKPAACRGGASGRRVGVLAANPHLRTAGRWLARLRDRTYPPLEPMPPGRWPRIALGIVAVMAVAFVAFFAAYLFALHDAYLTHAEDLGIMDQAIWNTVNGAPLHQTVCNIVSDTNCLGDISRLAIHFEPILFPLSLLYLIAPSPKTLQLVQAVVVAAGAFPAFWLAARRLRSAFAGIAFAAAYLLYPALQAAVTYDFHAVTLAAAFLLFALYFMLARNNTGLVIASVLAMSTKEEVPLAVLLIGLSVALLQRRGRLGWGLVALSVAWIAVEVVIMRAASPLGRSPTAGRYAYLGGSPVDIVANLLGHPLDTFRAYILERNHQLYLRSLLAPLAYLPLLSPLTLLIAVPALAINLLSSNPAMYSGIYHYNAEIVPVMILAGIESVALLGGAVGWGWRRVTSRMGATVTAWSARTPGWMRGMTAARLAILLATLLTLGFSVRAQAQHGYTPLTAGFAWPQQTAHARLADRFIQMIPADASVSAQSDLVPHLSHRRFIYLYPYRARESDYILLDVTGNLYPQATAPQAYASQVRGLLTGGAYHLVAAEDGYLLLKRGAGATLNPADPYGLPESFYSFTTAASVPRATGISFGPSLELVGYDVSPAPRLYVNNPYLTVTTYWRVTRPLGEGYMPELVFTRADGSEYVSRDFASTTWRPMSQWQPGTIYAVRSWPLLLTSREAGTLRLGARVRVSGPSGAFTPVPAQVRGAASGAALPVVLGGGTVGVFYDERVIG